MVLNVSEVRPDQKNVVEVEHSGILVGKLVPRQEHLIVLSLCSLCQQARVLFSTHAS